jgi:peptide-methionine (S)-S-oxide reductase
MSLRNVELATLGTGCFWCTEAIFQELKGVISVVSGYAGGYLKNPTYRQICEGNTGHAEVVSLEFDPQVISFPEILDVFWTVHDRTTLNRQGADVGPQYRSVIFYHNEKQKKSAEQSLQNVGSKIWADPIVTEITEINNYFPAENYHQEYYNNNENQPYCRIVINPKIQKFRKLFAAKLKK